MIKIYGPYGGIGRKCIYFYDTVTKKRTGMSYSKYLLEQKIGRKLVGDETCDHIDGDYTNDELNNLRVLSRSENSAWALKRRPAKKRILKCNYCDQQFERYESSIPLKVKNGVARSYCSRKCFIENRKLASKLTPLKQVILKCNCCNQQFERYEHSIPLKIKKGDTNSYCSKTCFFKKIKKKP